MIYKNTLVRACDNSGVKLAECIKVLKVRYQHAKLADMVILAVKTAYTNKKIKRHDVCTGIIVRMRKKTTRTNGFRISFGDNAVAIIDSKNKNNLAGTRILGPAVQELRSTKYTKILVMANCII